MKITSTCQVPRPPKPAVKERQYPVAMRWLKNEGGGKKDPYVTGEHKLIVLFTSRFEGIALVNTGDPDSVGVLYPTWTDATDETYWEEFKGKVTLKFE